MKEQLITFIVAKLAKEKGFKEEGVYYYNNELNYYNFEDSIGELHNEAFYKSIKNHNDDIRLVSAPTQSLLQKWLRNTFNIFVNIEIDQTCEPKFVYTIDQFIGNPDDLAEKEWYWIDTIQSDFLYRTYEEALEEGLKIALTLIKI